MRGTIAIVFTFFIIIDKTSQELKFPFQKKGKTCWSTRNPNTIAIKENNTFIVIEEPSPLNKTKGPSLNLNKDPTVVRRKARCLCGLPVCKCQNENPEKWFVKTFIRSDTQITPAMYSIMHCNSTVHCDDPWKGDYCHRKENESLQKKVFSNLCCKKRKEKRENKWIYGCPPLINLSKKGNKGQKNGEKEDMSFQCECLQCKLQSGKSKSGVLMKCVECGPIYTNKFNEKINFSKLIHKRKNKLKMNVKFLQVN